MLAEALHHPHEVGRHPARLGEETGRAEHEDPGVPVVPAGPEELLGLRETGLLHETHDFIYVGNLRGRDFKITEVGVGAGREDPQNDDRSGVGDPGRRLEGAPKGFGVGDRVVRRDGRGDGVAVTLEVERRP